MAYIKKIKQESNCINCGRTFLMSKSNHFICTDKCYEIFKNLQVRNEKHKKIINGHNNNTTLSRRKKLNKDITMQQLMAAEFDFTLCKELYDDTKKLRRYIFRNYILIETEKDYFLIH